MQSVSESIERRLGIVRQIALLLLHGFSRGWEFERQMALRSRLAGDESEQGLVRDAEITEQSGGMGTHVGENQRPFKGSYKYSGYHRAHVK